MPRFLPRLADIARRPKKGDPPPRPPKTVNLRAVERFYREHRIPDKKSRNLGKRALLTIIIAFLVFSLGAASGVYILKLRAKSSVNEAANNFRQGVESAKGLDLEKAGSEFEAAGGALEGVRNKFQFLFSLDKYLPFLKNLSGAYGSAQNIISTASKLSEVANWTVESLPQDFIGGRGDKVLESLGKIKEGISSLRLDMAAFSESAASFGLKDDYSSSALVELSRYEQMLDIAFSWLSASEGKKVLIFFGNTAELRPGGGFNGSYAEVDIKGGAISQVIPRDINEPDRVMNRKIIPPKPVQAIASQWRGADANWFFSFPDSAEKTLAFLESSGIYSEKNERFDGMIAITPAVASDLLGILGPVKLSNGKIINSENIAEELQRDVQEGQASKSAEPKKLIKELVPAIREALSNLPSEKISQISEMMSLWGENRDLMVYFRDPRLMEVVNDFGASGRIYKLDPSFNGSYFAPVFANLGGGKSDLAMINTVRYEAQIQPDGSISAKARIIRTHNGRSKKEWWYREPSLSYVKVFLPFGSVLQEADGMFNRVFKPRADYSKGFERDGQVSAIEETIRPVIAFPGFETMDEYERTAVGFWQKVPLGEEGEIVLDYTNKNPFPAKDGRAYSFVLERQAGLSASLRVQIFAPLGYVFKESGLSAYEVDLSEMPANMEITLTLIRD